LAPRGGEPDVAASMKVAFLLALVTVTATAVSQAMLKHGMNNIGSISPSVSQVSDSARKIISEPYIVGGLVLIFIVFPLWLEVLARLPLSIAYPMVSMGYIVAIAIGALVFKESITSLKVIGMILIIMGIVALSQSE
jgi:multidrug transporter EmrE-like cation transporter